MLLQTLFCGFSIVAVAVLYAAFPALSLWWLLPLFAAGFVTAFLLMVLFAVILTRFMRGAQASAARRFTYRYISHIAEWACFLCGMRVKADGLDRLPKDRPFLIVGNHLSNLDPLVALAALRGFEVPFVSKPENFKIPVVGTVMRNAAFLAIDRENPRNAVTTIKTAAQQITARGLCIGIYPEGTRNKSGKGLLPFHNGSFKIATTAKCPVAVMTVRYEKAAFPYRKNAVIRILEVLDADYITANRTDAISERARETIENDLKN